MPPPGARQLQSAGLPRLLQQAGASSASASTRHTAGVGAAGARPPQAAAAALGGAAAAAHQFGVGVVVKGTEDLQCIQQRHRKGRWDCGRRGPGAREVCTRFVRFRVWQEQRLRGAVFDIAAHGAAAPESSTWAPQRRQRRQPRSFTSARGDRLLGPPHTSELHPVISAAPGAVWLQAGSTC